MNKNALLLGLLFAISALVILVLNANNMPHRNFVIIIITAGFIPSKLMQRKKQWVSNKSAITSIILAVIGIILFVTKNTYAYSVIGFALLSDIMFQVIFKRAKTENNQELF